jgi:hypothetical protein
MENQNLEEVHGYGYDNLLIELSSCGSSVRVGGKKPNWQSIKYDLKGEPYLTHYGKKYELSGFLRVEAF